MQSEMLLGDSLEILKTLPDEHVNCCVTSPPYWGLRDYGVQGQLGLEDTPEAYVENMVKVFREVRRVLKDDGTLWLNIGDSYSGSGKGAYGDGVVRLSEKSAKQATSAGTTEGIFKKLNSGLKPKDLVGIPWRLAFALQADGWYLRQDIIWHKPNVMPESVKDRVTKAHEYIFLLSKSPKYYFDSLSIREPAVKGAAGSTFHKGKTGEHQMGRSSTKPRKQDSKVESHVPGSGDHSGLHKAGSDREPMWRNKRSVWSVTTKPFKGAHFATFPPDLIEPCILAGCPENGLVLDPFFGSGTTGLVCRKLNRYCIGIELNEKYYDIAWERLCGTPENLPTTLEA